MVVSYCCHSGGYHVVHRIYIVSEKALNDTSNFLIFMYGVIGDSLTELGLGIGSPGGREPEGKKL
jgi:hypothetical protein